ncbi:hypothetical protein F5Y15DRAFT_420584 [Xylariaceae sp. FL0016]|nr:hypothetical protein F5Y15DRAFT_420584 [Xylariaceae sp. FL0016]
MDDRSPYNSRSPTPRSRNSQSPTPPPRRRRSTPRSRSRSASPPRRNGRYRSDSRSMSRGRGDSRSPLRGSTKIVVEKLSKTINEEHLREIFGQYGPINDLHLPMNRQFNHNRGTAYILYTHEADAEAAIAHMHEAHVDGAVINVSIVLPRRKFSPSPPTASRGANIDPRLPAPTASRRGGGGGMASGGFGGRGGFGGGRGPHAEVDDGTATITMTIEDEAPAMMTEDVAGLAVLEEDTAEARRGLTFGQAGCLELSRQALEEIGL